MLTQYERFTKLGLCTPVVNGDTWKKPDLQEVSEMYSCIGSRSLFEYRNCAI
jgi:hypothetical protein